MIPDGLTCTLWGRSASVFFQGCAWVVVCVHACVLPRLHECTCVVVRICAELPASAPALEHVMIMSVSFFVLIPG